MKSMKSMKSMKMPSSVEASLKNKMVDKIYALPVNKTKPGAHLSSCIENFIPHWP